jgi:hypothetical protein
VKKKSKEQGASECDAINEDGIGQSHGFGEELVKHLASGEPP